MAPKARQTSEIGFTEEREREKGRGREREGETERESERAIEREGERERQSERASERERERGIETFAKLPSPSGPVTRVPTPLPFAKFVLQNRRSRRGSSILTTAGQCTRTAWTSATFGLSKASAIFLW